MGKTTKLNGKPSAIDEAALDAVRAGAKGTDVAMEELALARQPSTSAGGTDRVIRWDKTQEIRP